VVVKLPVLLLVACVQVIFERSGNPICREEVRLTAALQGLFCLMIFLLAMSKLHTCFNKYDTNSFNYLNYFHKTVSQLETDMLSGAANILSIQTFPCLQ
jgi:hypothetical protein